MGTTAQWRYRKTDNVFVEGGMHHDVVNPDPTQFGIVSFAADAQPDPRLHRFDPATGDKRPATAQELADAVDATLSASSQTTSRQIDILTTIAFCIRQKDSAAWNAMTPAQKKAAVLAGADQWRDMRLFIAKSVL